MFPVKMENLRCPNVAIISTDKTFDALKKEFDNKGYQMASLTDYARIMLMRQNGGIYSTRTKEAFIYTPDKVYLSRNSPILADPEQATGCHKRGLEFYLNERALKGALEGAIEVKYLNLPTEGFIGDDLANFVFGAYSKDFGMLLSEIGIKKMHIWLCAAEAMPFARQAYIEHRPDSNMFILTSMNLNAGVNSIGLKSDG